MRQRSKRAFNRESLNRNCAPYGAFLETLHLSRLKSYSSIHLFDSKKNKSIVSATDVFLLFKGQP